MDIVKISNFWKLVVVIFPLLLIGMFGYTALSADSSANDNMHVVDGTQEQEMDIGPTTTPAGAVMINPMKQQLIGVKKYTVQEKKLVKTIRTVGRVYLF